MKQQLLVFLFLLTIASFFSSCQKEKLENSKNSPEEFASKMNATKVPFKAIYITTAEFLQGPAVQRISGTGEATHLGQSIFVAIATVNFRTPPPFAIAGTATFTAANGDQFFTRFTGISTPTGIGTSRGIINHTIIGGNGRFENATGSLSGIALVNAASPTNTVSYEGTISY